MVMQMKAVFSGVSEKVNADGRKIFKGVATSLALDRHREVVVPKGVNLTNFLENPVLMRQHEHHEEPIGRLLSIDPGDKTMPFEFIFDEADPEAARVMGKVERGFMKTFSIGFLPLKWVDQEELVDETGKMLDTVELDIGNSMKYTLDLTQYKATPRRVYTQWEMLEISLVSIPANPEAQIRMLAKEFIESREDLDDAGKSFLEENINDRISLLSSTLKEFEKELEDYHVNGLVAPHSTKMVEETLDYDKAQAHLAKWASSDGTGNKETMAWGKYARGFSKFAVDKKDTFSAYTMLHHDVVEGELVTSKSMLCSAMSTLLSNGKSEEIGADGEVIYQHLSKHYQDAGLVVPAFGKTYSTEELGKIADGTWSEPEEIIEVKTPEVETPIAPVAASSDEQIVKLIAQVEKFREVIETRAIGFNIKFETILESVSEISRKLATKQVEPEVETPVVEDEVESTVVTGLKDALSFYKGGAGAGN